MILFDIPGQGFYYDLLEDEQGAGGGRLNQKQATKVAFNNMNLLTFALLGAGDPSLGVGLRV